MRCWNRPAAGVGHPSVNLSFDCRQRAVSYNQCRPNDAASAISAPGSAARQGCLPVMSRRFGQQLAVQCAPCQPDLGARLGQHEFGLIGKRHHQLAAERLDGATERRAQMQAACQATLNAVVRAGPVCRKPQAFGAYADGPLVADRSAPAMSPAFACDWESLCCATGLRLGSLIV